MRKGKIALDGHRFNSDEEYKRYLGLMELARSGRIEQLEVKPAYPLIVNDQEVDQYSPTFVFYDPAKRCERVIQVMGSGHQNALLEVRMRWFEAAYQLPVERWG